MKRVIILILTLIIFSSMVSAVNVEINAIQNHVLKGQNATFTVMIDNDAFEDKLFTIKSIDLNYILQESPLVEHLAGKSKGTYELTFVPLKDLEPRIYGVSLIVISDKGDRIERYVSINLLKNEDVLDVEISSSGPINPTKPATLNLKVSNKYEISFDNLYTRLTSSFMDKEFSFPLDKKEEHVEDFVVNLDPNLKSGSYSVRAFIKYGDYILSDRDVNVEVGSITKLNEIINTENGLLVRKEVVRKINNGNAVIEETYERELSLAEKLFTSAVPKPDQISGANGRYTLTWNLRVEPEQEVVIVLYRDYKTPLLLFLIIILIGYFIYRYKMKAVIIKKRVMTLHTSERDFILSMKVLVSVKNRRNRLVRKLIVRERVPNLTREPKDFGALKPSSVEKMGNDMILTWEIGSLRPREERILAYKAENKLHVIGKLRLPPTAVKYEDRNKKQIAYSNSVSVNMKNQ